MKHILLVLLTISALQAVADVKPAGVFSDNAVLQQNQAVRIWGMADPSEKIIVNFGDQAKRTFADSDGYWIVTLDPMFASAKPRDLKISGADSQVSFCNVVVGEVWLAGGQSNMETTMGYYSRTSQPDIDRADDPLLRMVTIPRLEWAGQHNAQPQWKMSNPQDVKTFSACAYYFAKELREKLGVPVGIVSCSVGGTPAEAWMSRETLASNPDLNRVVEAYDTHVKKTYADEEDYREKAAAYQKAWDDYWKAKKLEDTAQRLPKPKEVMGPRNYKRPGGLYENMLLQTIPYTIKGAIWYQGENNASSQAGHHYRSVFSTLIKEWREEFLQPEFPFLFVQLATLGWGDDPHWPELRDAQKWVAEKVPNTGMVVLLDGGEKNDIHPHSKPIAGHRLALLARNMVYGETDLVCHGPSLAGTKIRGSVIELTFSNVGRGLVLKPAGENTFELCGADGVFVPAKAELIDGIIFVSAEGLDAPEHVRYGWHKWVVPTVYNKEGLPASPFRTDVQLFASRGRHLLDQLNGD